MPDTDLTERGSVENAEPVLASTVLFVGQSCGGCWVVRDRLAKRGALFASRAEALRFAMFETDFRPQAIVMMSGFLELETALPAEA